MLTVNSDLGTCQFIFSPHSASPELQSAILLSPSFSDILVGYCQSASPLLQKLIGQPSVFRRLNKKIQPVLLVSYVICNEKLQNYEFHNDTVVMTNFIIMNSIMMNFVMTNFVLMNFVMKNFVMMTNFVSMNFISTNFTSSNFLQHEVCEHELCGHNLLDHKLCQD